MPNINGSGPLGRGPMTGKGMGFCLLKKENDNPHFIEGKIGIEGKSYFKIINSGKEVNDMPFGDGTGPAGMGSMTGRAAGYCAGYGMPGYMNPVPGQGIGFGFGRGGRGRRNWFYATGLPGWQRAGYGFPFRSAWYGNQAPYSVPPEQEMDMLRKQSEYLEKTLTDLNQRIQELESAKKNKS
jgi:hypothetical protein